MGFDPALNDPGGAGTGPIVAMRTERAWRFASVGVVRLRFDT
jgi:hypothetical protein